MTINKYSENKNLCKEIFQDIINNGGQPYFVGGFVRDSLLKIKSKDIDIEVYKISYENLINILKKYGKIDLVGKSFGIIKLIVNGQDFDFSLPRKDSKNGIGHKGFNITFDKDISIEEAASRRDFTINSMSVDIDGNLIDPFNGKSDLDLGILRPTSEAFLEDSLRCLRGLQFSARFNMIPSTGFMLDAVEMGKEFNTLPKERIWEEFKKFALKGKYYSKALKTLKNICWAKFFPELNAIYGVKQDQKWHPEGSVDIHTGYVMDHMAVICEREDITGDNRLVLIFAALCHDFGKATHTQFEDGRIRSRGHEKASGPLAQSFLESIGCPLNIIERVIPLVENHMLCQTLSDKAIRKLSNRLGKATIRELCFLIEADQCGRPPLPKKCSDNLIYLAYKAAKLNVLDGKPEQLISGKDLLRLGFEPSPVFGKTLKKLYQMQLDGKNINDKTIAQIHKSFS